MSSFGHSVEGSRDGGKFINYQLAPEDILLTCPYDSSHRVQKSRFGRHLAKCRENYKKAKKAQKQAVDVRICRWNAFHHYPAPEIDYHEETCSDRAEIVGHLEMLTNPEITNVPIVKNESTPWVDGGEDWEDEANANRAQNPHGYNPQKKLKNSKGLIVSLPGITTKSEREAFRAEQYNKFVNSGGNFQDPSFPEEDGNEADRRTALGFSIASTSTSQPGQFDETAEESVSHNTSYTPSTSQPEQFDETEEASASHNTYYTSSSSSKLQRSSEGFQQPGGRPKY